jgi:2'-5' RNA ligase/prophage maintenance system killer protein
MATKRANIFDPIQKNLDQKVYNGITPRPRVIKFITDEMQKVLTPILGFDPLEFMDLYLTGSLTTYQYSETSDCDISVFIKWDLWPTGQDPNTIRRKIIPVVMNKLDGTNVPGTEHPIQHFVVPPGTEPHDLYKPGLRSAWSFRDHKWLVPPEKDRVHDISVELPVLYSRAELMADKMDTLLQVNPIYAKEFWHQIHRKRTMDQQAGLGDFSEGNIVYKYLLHNGYFDRIRDELGEKIAKHADWDENFDMSTYDQYIPPVGSIWTIADPWALTKNPPGPTQRTVQIEDVEGRYIWYRDLDTQTGKDQRDGMSISMWNDKMHRQVIRQKAGDWQFQESPEEAAEYWPDTLPQNWSKQAATLRLFIAFDPPDQTVAEIIKWQQANAPEGVRLHTPEMLHMTLAFLGNVEETEVPRLLQMISQLDPSAVTISGPEHYEEIRGKQGVLVWQESGGNAVWQQLNQLLYEWNGYQPQYDPWLPHTTVWEYPGGTGEGYQPQLPVIAPWSPVRVGLYKSEKAPGGGGQFTLITKTADDLSWVDKSTPYGTPDGGFIGGPEHWGDDSIDLPSEPSRDLVPPDNENVTDPKGSLKVIYDFERDQIILGDVKKADQFPPGQIIGDYRNGDVYLNAHAEAWFNANYFKRLWQHSFPKRPIRHVILDKGNGQHEVVHRHPTSAILPEHEDLDHLQEEGTGSREEAREAASGAQEDLVWPEDWESIDNISQAAVDNHQGYRDPGLIMGAVGNVKMQRMYGAHGDIFDTAANLIGKVQRQQAVVEGNKRTATLLGLNFLEENGFDTQPLAREGVWQQLVNLVYNLSDSSEESVEALANFLRVHLNG